MRLFSIFQFSIMHSVCPPSFAWNTLGNVRTSQEHFTTTVDAKHGKSAVDTQRRWWRHSRVFTLMLPRHRVQLCCHWLDIFGIEAGIKWSETNWYKTELEMSSSSKFLGCTNGHSFSRASSLTERSQDCSCWRFWSGQDLAAFASTRTVRDLLRWWLQLVQEAFWTF